MQVQKGYFFLKLWFFNKFVLSMYPEIILIKLSVSAEQGDNFFLTEMALNQNWNIGEGNFRYFLKENSFKMDSDTSLDLLANTSWHIRIDSSTIY